MSIISWNIEDLIEFRNKFPLKKTRILDQIWFYIDSGLQSRFGVVFIHGTTGSAEIFWNQIRYFSSSYRVISITIPPIMGKEILCQGLFELFQRIGIEEMIILGTSFGGYLVQAFATYYPTMVKGLILGNTFYSTEPYHAKYKYFLIFKQLIPNFIIKRMLKKGLITIHHQATREYLVEQLDKKLSKKTLVARLETFITNIPLKKVLNKPLLIIETVNDPLVPLELQVDLKNIYSNATVEIFDEEANHFPYLTQPEKYTEALKVFIEKINKF